MKYFAVDLEILRSLRDGPLTCEQVASRVDNDGLDIFEAIKALARRQLVQQHERTRSTDIAQRRYALTSDGLRVARCHYIDDDDLRPMNTTTGIVAHAMSARTPLEVAWASGGRRQRIRTSGKGSA